MNAVFSMWSVPRGYKEDNWGNQSVLYASLKKAAIREDLSAEAEE
jgi:hypothetical protein